MSEKVIKITYFRYIPNIKKIFPIEVLDLQYPCCWGQINIECYQTLKVDAPHNCLLFKL